MARLTVWVGLLLIVLGVVSYVRTDMVSPTALIPTAFGVVFALLGVSARNEAKRKTIMHIAMGLALVGIVGTASGLMKLPALMSGEAVERPQAVMAQALMAILLLVYLALGIKSFVDARR